MQGDETNDINNTHLYHLIKKWSFLLKISSVNMTKSEASSRFDHFFRRNV